MRWPLAFHRMAGCRFDRAERLLCCYQELYVVFGFAFRFVHPLILTPFPNCVTPKDRVHVMEKMFKNVQGSRRGLARPPMRSDHLGHFKYVFPLHRHWLHYIGQTLTSCHSEAIRDVEKIKFHQYGN